MPAFRISLWGSRGRHRTAIELSHVLSGLAGAVESLRCTEHAIEAEIYVPAEYGRDRLEQVLGEMCASDDLRYQLQRQDAVSDGPAWRLTVLAERPIPASCLQELLQRLDGQNLVLDGMRSLANSDTRCVWQLSCHGPLIDEEHLQECLQQIGDTYRVDCNWVADSLASRYPRLAVFDMDSTLIACECIDELAKAAGTGAEVSAITEAAMQGELDFSESFRKRLGTLQGLPEQAVQELIDRLPVMPGIERLTKGLRAIGCRMVIASGGFTHVAQVVAERYGFDAVVANELEVVDGLLTGRHIGGIVDGQRKAAVLHEQATEHGIPITHTIAIGDGANDLGMMAAAGTGVAYHAKPLVRAKAPQRLSTVGLDGVLYLIGLDDRDIDEVLD